MCDVRNILEVDGRIASALAGLCTSDGALLSLATVKLFGFASSTASPSPLFVAGAAADRARREDAEKAAADVPPSRGSDVR